MSYLLLHGNTNQHTFANTIVAANERSKELFGGGLEKIFVIHSMESEEKLLDLRKEWGKHIEQNGISLYDIEGKVINLADDSQVSIQRFVDHIEFLFNGVGVHNSGKWMVDLTNGTSVQKNLLSICSYILDIKHQYMINIAELSKLTQERGFLDAKTLSQCYDSAPDSTLMDGFAYLDLSEMNRYKRVVEQHSEKFRLLNEGRSDDKFFSENLTHAIKLKLEGDKKQDNALFRIATTSISASLEELAIELSRGMEFEKLPTFGARLIKIREKVEKIAPEDFDREFLKKFTDLILYLRNSTTHKSKILNDLERFKADLALKMAFPFLEFCFDILQPILAGEEALPTEVQDISHKQIRPIAISEFTPNTDYFYGLDGDNTGGILEGMFLDESSEESGFKNMSGKVSNAIKAIGSMVKKNDGHIIFNAGDDLLFRGKFSAEELREMQNRYKEMTNGNTCSIAFGKTLHETYLAMKLAKATPGKNTIMGIELLNTPPS